MGSVSLQWSLDQTSDSLIGISRGFLQAATSDNVQALALLACESFGTVVARSPESCYKVFLLSDRNHESAAITFLKASVGYSKGDCGYQLARSDAGQRFLGLAACLGSLGAWNAAVILHRLIKRTAKDNLLVPTTQHLKHLMQALDDRLTRAGFCDSVVGWAKIFVDEMAASGDGGQHPRLDNERHGVALPPLDTVMGLTEALSHIARVGEEGGSARVRILTTAGQAAWFVAFVKWCLGAPPRIVLHQGRALGSEATSPVTFELVRSTGRAQETRIETYDYANELKEVVRAASSLDRVRGMVTVGTFGQAMMRQRFGTPKDLKYRACAQALPHACDLVRHRLRVCRESSAARTWIADSSNARSLSQPTGGTAALGQVFPAMDKIERKIHEYRQLDADQLVASPLMPPGSMIETVPLVSLVKSQLRQVCSCRRCQNTGTSANKPCLFIEFLSDISRCVAEVMTLSILNPIDPDGVLVYFGCDTWGTFVMRVRELLQCVGDGPVATYPSCSTSDILHHVTRLLGHEKLEMSSWVMSSYHDQTIYPRLLSTQVVQHNDILSLDCIPGYIMWGTERYSRVEVSALYRHWDFSDEDSDVETEIEPGALTRQIGGDLVRHSFPVTSFRITRLGGRLPSKTTGSRSRCLFPNLRRILAATQGISSIRRPSRYSSVAHTTLCPVLRPKIIVSWKHYLWIRRHILLTMRRSVSFSAQTMNR